MLTDCVSALCNALCSELSNDVCNVLWTAALHAGVTEMYNDVWNE